MHIALVRHGTPEGVDNRIVGPGGFAHWVRCYERSRVRADSVPPGALARLFAEHYVVSSMRPRSLHSVEKCFGRGPDLRLADLREMDIPRYRLPFRLPAYVWLVVNRAIWVAGLAGPFESFREARQRARRVSEELNCLAVRHGRLVVFGHALMNWRIARDLRRSGWRITRRRAHHHWGVTDLERVSTEGVDGGAHEPRPPVSRPRRRLRRR